MYDKKWRRPNTAHVHDSFIQRVRVCLWLGGATLSAKIWSELDDVFLRTKLSSDKISSRTEEWIFRRKSRGSIPILNKRKRKQNRKCLENEKLRNWMNINLSSFIYIIYSSRAEIDNPGASISIFLLKSTFFAIISINNSNTTANNAAPLVFTEVTFITNANLFESCG